ncbi:hypothetical protein Franean1_4002 [Parafrankia sp. EAN1pec]|nr:hypothetical protein Franean1_4002 [Frankia sp. EAN1pec]
MRLHVWWDRRKQGRRLFPEREPSSGWLLAGAGSRAACRGRGPQEHHVADLLAVELAALPPDAERFSAKATVLIENVTQRDEPRRAGEGPFLVPSGAPRF